MLALRPPLAALALTLLMSNTANADITGNIYITVNTTDNRPLANTTIRLTSRNGQEHQITTDKNGIALINDLDIDLYRISTHLEGYTNVVEPSVRVVRDKTIPVEFTLPLQARAGFDEEVVTIAEGVKKDPFGAVSGAYLDREHLRTATGSGADVLRALDGLPGLVSTGAFASFTVRGRGPRDNLILVDGFPYDRVVHFDQSLGEQDDINGGGRFSIFAPNLIEGAEFSPGGWSAAYGGRNGSLLKLDVAKGNPSPSASVRLDPTGTELVYDGPSGVHQDTSLIVTARRFDFGRLFDAIGQNDIGTPVLTDFIVKTHTKVNPSNQVELLFLYTPETFERTVANVLESEDFENRALINTEQDSTLFGLSWFRQFGHEWQWQWENRFYWRDTEKASHQGEAFPNTTPELLQEDQVPVREDIFAITEDEAEFGWRSDLSTTNAWGEFSTGFRIAQLDLALETQLSGDWIRYTFDGGDFQVDPAQRFIVLTPQDTNAQFVQSELQYAAFAEQVFNFGDWDLRSGLRYEHDGFSEQNDVSPRLALNYKYSPTTRFAATAGTFYQPPRFLERARDPDNFNLESERIDHLSFGVDRNISQHWNVLVELYYQQLSNLLTDTDRVTGRTSNNGEGESFGVDIVANKQFAHGWSANAVYSYNNASLDDNDGNGEYAADFNHEHLLSVGGRWEINQRWQFGFRWKYATGRPRDEFIVHDDVLAAQGGPLRFSQEFISNNTQRWEAFHTLNVRVDYRRPVGELDLIAFLDVLNVYGATNTDTFEFNPVTGTLAEGEGGSFPLIGIRFELAW